MGFFHPSIYPSLTKINDGAEANDKENAPEPRIRLVVKESEKLRVDYSTPDSSF